MLITVTLNPAIDKTIEVKKFQLSSLNKVIGSQQDPGGKGINVSRVIQSLGGEALATGFVAGPVGQYITTELSLQGIPHAFVAIDGNTRTNMKILDLATRSTTEINEPGPEVSEEDLYKLVEGLKAVIKPPCIVVLAGSAPPTVDRDVYGILIEAAKEMGAKVFLDADGEWFRQGIKAIPNYIKPNRAELESYFGRVLETKEDLIKAASIFIEKGVEHVFITLGHEGALYISADTQIYMAPLSIEAHSSVGAGDAFVAACVYGFDCDMAIEDVLRLAVATSAGAVTTRGTNPVSFEWITEKINDVILTHIK